MAKQTWMQESLCKDLSPEESDKLFFIGPGQSSKRAKLFCATCPVRVPCSQYAMTYAEEGVWAGETEDERRFTNATFGVRDQLKAQAASQGRLESRNLNDFLPQTRRPLFEESEFELSLTTLALLEELLEVPDLQFEGSTFLQVNDL